MRNVTKFLLTTLVCLALMLTGIMWGYSKAQLIHDTQLRQIHTECIEALGDLAEKSHRNVDVMMRYSHYTEHHTEEMPLCPECTKDIESIFEEDVHVHEEDTIPDQDAIGDADEILGCLHQQITHADLQYNKLFFTLKRLREGCATH